MNILVPFERARLWLSGGAIPMSVGVLVVEKNGKQCWELDLNLGPGLRLISTGTPVNFPNIFLISGKLKLSNQSCRSS
jgi:hypothetical protein